MMKILKITLLWIAGALVLGHSIIPHHHHLAEQIECADDHISHEHQKTIIYAATYACQHHENHSKICSIDQRTLVKQTLVGNWAILIKNFKVVAPEKNITSIVNRFTINKLSDYFLSKTPSRAPPIA